MFLTLTVSAEVWGAEGDTHDFPQSLSQLLNNNASVASIEIAEQSYTIKTVKITSDYNKTAGGVTMEVFVGGISWGTATHNSNAEKTFTFSGTSTKGKVTIKFTNNCGSGTGKGTFKVTTVQLVEGASASATKYKVTFNAGSGTCGTSSLTESTAGYGVTLPTATICDGWEFAGWATSSVATETTTAPTLLSEGSNYKPTGNCTLYAVYQRTEETEGNGGTENVSRSYTFSNFTAGTQYADNEVHKLDNDVTLTTTDCHFTSELRIYSSSTYNGYVVSNNLPGRIVSIGFNAGNKVDAIDVFGSTNGTDWTKVGQVSVTSTSYKDYTLNFGATNYTYFKLDVAGSNQVRLKSITITWESASAGGTITTTYYHSTPDCTPETSVTLNPNEGSGTMDAVTTQNGTLTLPKCTFTREGYTFAGWATSADGEVAFADEEVVSNWDADITELYAQWTQKVYTVTATSNNNNYGTVSVSGTTITASPKTGYTYANPAYTVTSGTAIVTQNGNTFTVTPSTNCTIRINFEAKPKYTVKFYKTSTTFESVTEASVGAGVTPPTMEQECGGWTFQGWSESPSNSETSTTELELVTLADGKYNPTKDVNLYPVYTKIEGEGGSSIETLSQTLQYDTWSYGGSTTNKSSYRLFHSDSYIESTEFDLSTLSKVIVYGGTFGGDSYNKLTIAGLVGNNTTTWKSVTVSGSSQTGVNTYTGGASLSGTGKLRVTSNSGSSSNNGVRISKILIYTLQATSTTYYYSYPQCTTETIVTLNPNGGTGGTTSVTATYGQSMPTITPATLAGYALTGYFDAASGGTKYYNADGTSAHNWDKETPTTTLYAQWTELPTYTVSFSTGTGNPTQAAIKETTGGAGITLPAGPTPTCTDWDFAGWATASVSVTTTAPTLLSEGDNYTPTEDCTLYAVYSKTETTQGGGMEVATLTTSEISGAYIKNTTTQYGNYTINSQSGTWGGLIYIGENYIQISANDANRHLESPTFSGNISNITITGRHNASKTRNIYICSSNTTAKPTNGDIGSGSINSSGVENEYTDWKDVSISVSGDNKKFYVYADGGLQIQSIVVTYSGGSSSTTYNSNPTCLVPVWDGATIDKTSFTVNCGERSPMTGANGAAKITFPTEKIYNFTSAITIEATTGFLVSTSQSVDANYKSSVSLSPLVGTTNANTFYEKPIYVRAEAPAMSEESLSGTITIKNNNGETLQTFSVTADVTCNTYTLTLNDRGTKTTAEYYAGASVPKPADPEGVCTDPINYVFDGWSLNPVTDENTTSYEKVTFPFDMPAEKKTLHAVYRYTEGNTDSDKFMSVDKEIGELVNGMDYVLTGYNTDDKEYALSCIQYESGKYKTKQIDVSESTTMYDEENPYYELTTTDNEIIWTITGDDEDGYSFQNKATGKYLNIKDGSLALNNDEPTKYTIEHYVGYDSESGKYVQYLDVIIQPSDDASNYLSSYYKNSTAGVLFNLHNSSTLQLYLYKRAAATLYTTSPACGPMLEITSGKDIYVTSGFGTGRNTVIAQQTVEYRATRLKTQNGSVGGKAPDVKVAANGITIGGEVTDKVKVVELTQNKELIGDKYTITGTVTVQYTPTANNLQEEIQVQLAVDYNSEAKDNFTVHARSLPAEFVIVAKSSDKWYALNGDMNNGSSANPANGQVTLDNDANPTEATYAPCNAIYTFDGVPNTGDRTRVRFQGTDGAWLWASSGTNVGIQNKSLKDTPEGNNNAYNWKLETEDNITYKFHNDNNSRLLGLNGEKFGMYASGVQDIRILPYEAKCIYNYAPTNLKVSVLKGTYVTLTWDAVAGATKYQYRTDDTNWTDCGTEPTVTINGLTGETKYIYYVRAYHEDAGVSQECIDYAKITFTTANCDDVPTNITYTADLNSITVSWTAAAPTATIKLYLDENGEHAIFTQNGTTSPWKISTLSKNTTYYLQIFSNGTCASPIVPVKTEDVEVDIVEWMPDGIIVDINTDETVGVTLENEVSFGSGLGTEATELFFSKYYEASYNVKLVAIYNGTKNIIDLTDYIIKYGKTSWESNYITLKDFGATKGQIQPGEEIILYSMQDGNQDEEIMDCVHEDFPDGNWVRVTSSNNTGKGTLSFAGDKTLALFKGKNIIDIIGAVNGSIPDNSKANEKPTWGDANGWICATGLSLADDSEIGISTNRCLLIRNNTVTSGENAVTQNIDDFVTLCTEWKGAQVPDSDIDNGVAASCENFAYVGTFDYSDYYTKYVSMGDEKEFDENARNADGTVTIPITDLYKQSCRNIRIKLSNSNGDVLTDREYKVPIMITTTQGTDGQAFLDLQQNLATKEVDGEGNVIETHPLSLAAVREICKTCDVVVRDNATLTKMADDAANDHPQVRDIYVYENSSLIVPNGTNYTINNLSLRRKEDAVASVSAYPEALILPESAAAPISLDFRLSAESWHWFTLPYNCNISEVTWVDGSPAQYNVDWFLMTYDGKTRAETQTGGNWKAYTGTTIKAGEGFILAINGNINNPAHTYELRFPMSKEVLAAEGTDKTVAVRAWGVETNIRPNHKGWNLVGNPYLAYYQRNNITNFEGLRLGQLTGPDSQTGYWTQTGDVPYVVVPIGAGYEAYEQLLASETDLLPFTAYFVQVGNDGTHNSTQDLKVSFDHSKLQLSATPMPASIVHRAPSEVNETEEPVIVGVALTNSLGESDKTSLVIADRFTNEYEMQADFFKWFGDYYKYYTKPVLYTIGADQGKRAFNALNEQLATQPIPMGLFAAKAGDYTFALNRRSDLSKVEEVWLHDANTNTYTNLMQNDYNFYTTKTDGGGRFTISVKLAPKVATSIDNVTADKVWATTHTKQVIVNGLENGMHLWLYDATGKLLYTEPTSNYQHTYSVPQTGTYFVSVMNGNQKQTIKVVVE